MLDTKAKVTKLFSWEEVSYNAYVSLTLAKNSLYIITSRICL